MKRLVLPCRGALSAALISAAGHSYGQAPANDNLASATPVSLDTVVAGTNVNATVEPSEPATHFTATAAAGVATGMSVWYSYQPNVDGLASFSVVAQGIGTTAVALQAAAYKGFSMATLTRVASANSTAGTATAAGVAYNSNLIELKAGERVYFQVTGTSATGAAPFDFKLSRYVRPGKVVMPRYSNWEWLHPLTGVSPTAAATWAATWKTAGDTTDYGVAPEIVQFSAPLPAPFGFGAYDGAPGIKTDIGTAAAANNNAAYLRSTFTLTADTSNLWAEVMVDDGAYIYIDDLPGIPVHIAAKLTNTSFNGTTYSTGLQDYRPQDGVFLTGAIPTVNGNAAIPGCRAYAPAGFITERQTRLVNLGGLTGKLTAGVHKIAVSLHQTGTGSSDNAFDLQLIDMGAYPLSTGTAGIAFTETNFVAGSTTASVVPAAEHHFAPLIGQTDLAWYCVTPAASARSGAVVSDTASGAQKALRLNGAKDSRFVTEPVNIDGIARYVASLRIRTNDTSSGFEATDGLRVFLEVSDDGVNFAEPGTPLDVQPQINGAEATTAFNAAFVRKFLGVTGNTSKFVRMVVTTTVDSTSEFVYVDDVSFSRCQLFPTVTNVVYNNLGDNDRANDTVTFDLQVEGSGNTAPTWTTNGFGAGNEVAGPISGAAVSITRPAVDGTGARQNVVFTVVDEGDSGCVANVTVTTPTAAIGAITVTNIVRNRGADASTTSDDTLTFDLLVAGTAVGSSFDVRSSDAGNTVLYGSGSYGTAGSITIPASVASITIIDGSLTTLTKVANVPVMGLDLAMGRTRLNGVNRILYSNPSAVTVAAAVVPSEWSQASGTGITPVPTDLALTVDETTTVLHPAAVLTPLEEGILESPAVDVTGLSNVRVTASLRAFESSAGSGFEVDDTFKIEVIEERAGGETTVNLVKDSAFDTVLPKNDLINGFDAATAAAYDADLAKDEFNAEGALAAEHSRGTFAFNYSVPADVLRVRVRVTAANDSAAEYFFLQNVEVTNEASADSDSDGLPDAWETTYFGNLAQGAAGDADGDGQNNAAELAAGTVPNDGKSVMGITTAVRADNLVDITFNSVSGKKYIVQRSADLGAPWTDAGATVTASGTTTTITAIPDGGATKYFFRIKLVP